MDIVYPLREGENEEFRYSLRTLRNLPHDNLWVVGDKPDWFVGNFIQGNDRKTKWFNAVENLRKAVYDDRIDDFVLMNDDFFIMLPCDNIYETPYWWRFRLEEHINRVHQNEWKQVLMRTRELLGFKEFNKHLSFTLHTPVFIEKDKMRQVFDNFDVFGNDLPPSIRSLYGNYWGMGLYKQQDVKITNRTQKWRGTTFLSTNDSSFSRGLVGKYIRQCFPIKSEYETVNVGG